MNSYLAAEPNMLGANTSTEKLKQLKAQIASLEQAAIQELLDRRAALNAELASIEKELADLTGKSVGPSRTRTVAPRPAGKSLPLQELKEVLAAAPEKTVNIRKENLDLANIKTLAKANPHLLRLGGKGAWPTVTLLK